MLILCGDKLIFCLVIHGVNNSVCFPSVDQHVHETCGYCRWPRSFRNTPRPSYGLQQITVSYRVWYLLSKSFPALTPIAWTRNYKRALPLAKATANRLRFGSESRETEQTEARKKKGSLYKFLRKMQHFTRNYSSCVQMYSECYWNC